jgi:hypothetical protein
MKTVFPTKLILTKEERHYLLSKIWALAGRPIQGDVTYKERRNKATFTAYIESPFCKNYTIEQFRSVLFNAYPRKHKNIKKEKEMNNNVINDEQKKVEFLPLIRFIIKEQGRTPDDDMCKTIARGMGLVEENWMVTKNKLEKKEGYVFTPIENGYKVEIVNPHKEEIEGIKRDLNRLTIRLQELENQNS